MTFKKYSFLIFLIIIGWNKLAAQTNDYFNESHLRYENYIYMVDIKTVLLHRKEVVLSNPIIYLNTDEKLLLNFDDLSGELHTYYYTFIHCDAHWKPSDLMPIEYLSQLQEDEIINYEYSRNPLQKYIHYKVLFPNNRMQISKSGNYLLFVYENGNKDELVLSKRFMVSEDHTDINAHIKQSSIVSERFSRQEIDFSIRAVDYEITNPYDALTVIIMQNNRWDNASTELKPMFINQDILEYNYDHDNVFDGGNEFRPFDLKSLSYLAPGIQKIARIDNRYHAFLLPDKKRSYLNYIYQGDINGRRFIRIDTRGFNSDTDADYIYVHFLLPYKKPVTNGDFYIFGELSGWNINPNYKLKYNTEAKAYELTAYLKQGYYNYEYMFVKDGTSVIDNTLLEGSHYETENEYSIIVYHRNLTNVYDRIIGYNTFNSSLLKK